MGQCLLQCCGEGEQNFVGNLRRVYLRYSCIAVVSMNVASRLSLSIIPVWAIYHNLLEQHNLLVSSLITVARKL